MSKNYTEDGDNISWHDTVEFTFPVTGGRVIKVYDADTITIATKLPFADSPLYRIAVRLNGIDAPEIKSKDPEEKEMAKLARDYLAGIILNKYVKIMNVEHEKYGRLLADVYLKDLHINALLLKEKYVVKYDGGTKQKPASWKTYITEQP